MKNFLGYFVIILALAACETQTKNDKTELTVKISGVADGSVALLEQRNEGEWILVDSATLTGGLSRLHFKTDYPDLYYVSVKGQRGYVQLILGSDAAELTYDINNPREATIKGSVEQTRYEKFLESLAIYDDSMSVHLNAYRSAIQSGNEDAALEAEARYNEVQQQRIEFMKKYTFENNTYVSSAIILSLNSYMLELEDLEPVVSNFDPSIQGSKFVKDLQERVAVLKRVAVGKKFTDFSQMSPEGKMINLASELEGNKLLLVDFWASWCGPCRRENPNIVAVYKDFKDKGFDVFGVSFDEDRDKWIEAIEKDQLNWGQVSDLQGWKNGAAALYGIQSIPHSVLLDENGIIIAKNLRGPELREKIAELLN